MVTNLLVRLETATQAADVVMAATRGKRQRREGDGGGESAPKVQFDLTSPISLAIALLIHLYIHINK